LDFDVKKNNSPKRHEAGKARIEESERENRGKKERHGN